MNAAKPRRFTFPLAMAIGAIAVLTGLPAVGRAASSDAAFDQNFAPPPPVMPDRGGHERTAPTPRDFPENALWSDGKDPLLIGRCVVGPLTMWQSDPLVERIAIDGITGMFEDAGLYPVMHPDPQDPERRMVCLFRLPRAGYHEPGAVTRRGRRPRVRLHGPDTEAIVELDPTGVIEDPAGFARLHREWLAGLRQSVERTRRHEPDHELELLLWLRFFQQLPEAAGRERYPDPLWSVLEGLAGLAEVRQAVALNRDRELPAPQPADQPVPEPLELPPVAVPPVDLPERAGQLAAWVPRSCYYLEWSTWRDFRGDLEWVASAAEAWAPGYHPLPPATLVGRYLVDLGFDRQAMLGDRHDGCGPVVLAGWDPFFAGGTSVMVLVASNGHPLPNPTGRELLARRTGEGILLVTNSERLGAMAVEASGKGRSLRDEPGFRAARVRLCPPATATGATEHLFAFFSDYWLTNLLSPRWVIQTARINALDQRLRLVFLLRTMWQAEHATEHWPTLDDLRREPLLPAAWQDWLLADLVDTASGPVSSRLGGLGCHTAIDRLPFAGVTADEARFYRQFRDEYARRWRQMDPIAWQLTRNPTGAWSSRLYVSPISNRSEYRSLRDFVWQPKPPHRFDGIDDRGQVFGISVAVRTQHLGPSGFFPISVNLPIYLRLWGYDFAPTPFAPEHWLDPRPEEDWQLSLARLPIAISVPQALTPLLSFVRGSIGPGPYPDFSVVQGIAAHPTIPLLATDSVEPGFITLGCEPSTLNRLSRMRVPPGPSAQPDCDVRAFIDFPRAPMLYRWLWQAAVVNRATESWRRQSRLRRLTNRFGPPSKAWRERLDRERVFPTLHVVPEQLLAAMPRAPGQRREGWRPFASIGATAGYDGLPAILREARRLDFAVSVEENALWFETVLHPPVQMTSSRPVDPDPAIAPARPTTPPRDRPGAASRTLDFDER